MDREGVREPSRVVGVEKPEEWTQVKASSLVELASEKDDRESGLVGEVILCRFFRTEERNSSED